MKVNSVIIARKSGATFALVFGIIPPIYFIEAIPIRTQVGVSQANLASTYLRIVLGVLSEVTGADDVPITLNSSRPGLDLFISQ
jgi:hypothetical protein